LIGGFIALIGVCIIMYWPRTTWFHLAHAAGNCKHIATQPAVRSSFILIWKMKDWILVIAIYRIYFLRIYFLGP
jgi:hypothetical protein